MFVEIVTPTKCKTDRIWRLNRPSFFDIYLKHRKSIVETCHRDCITPLYKPFVNLQLEDTI